MKKRYQYSLLFGVPGFFISMLVAFFIFGAAAGFTWLFVLGDNPWPDSVGNILPLLVGLTFLTLWVASMGAGYRIGKRFESDEIVPKKHFLISAGLTLAPIAFMVIYQLKVGNIGPKSESERCADYCLENGSVVSELSARNSEVRTCACYDSTGQQIIQKPLNEILTLK